MPRLIAVHGRGELSSNLGSFSHVISIWDAAFGLERATREIEGHFPHSKCLLCLFDDITEGEGILPSLEVLQAALEFSRESESLLVHCWAGISRSTAIAYAVLCEKDGPGKEAESYERLLSIRPIAQPNRLIVSLADKLLERNGAMILVNEKFRASSYMNGATDDEL